jgi:hypothetical protein
MPYQDLLPVIASANLKMLNCDDSIPDLVDDRRQSTTEFQPDTLRWESASQCISSPYAQQSSTESSESVHVDCDHTEELLSPCSSTSSLKSCLHHVRNNVHCNKHVVFSPDSELVHTFDITEWYFELRQERAAGDEWLQCARDRDRFLRRASAFEPLLQKTLRYKQELLETKAARVIQRYFRVWIAKCRSQLSWCNAHNKFQQPLPLPSVDLGMDCAAFLEAQRHGLTTPSFQGPTSHVPNKTTGRNCSRSHSRELACKLSLLGGPRVQVASKASRLSTAQASPQATIAVRSQSVGRRVHKAGKQVNRHPQAYSSRFHCDDDIDIIFA